MGSPKKTLVLGASAKEDRYSNLAVRRLVEEGHPVVAVGRKPGSIAGINILTVPKFIPGIHTVSIYLNPFAQQEYYNYIVLLNPKRVIFNPATENPEFAAMLDRLGIPYEESCNLVLLSLDQY